MFNSSSTSSSTTAFQGQLDPSSAVVTADYDLAGYWLTKVELPITWTGYPIARVADPNIRIWGYIDRSESSGGEYIDRFHLCDFLLPRFSTLAGKQEHGLLIPASVFDQQSFPPSPPYSLTKELGGGGAMVSGTVALSAGILPLPADAPWPPLEQTNLVDTDWDGEPGLTIVPDTTNGMKSVGLNVSASRKAARICIAMRVRFVLNARLVNANHMEGTAQSVGDALDIHILEGGVTTDGGMFTANEIDRLQRATNIRADGTRPGTVTMLKTAGAPTPADVRKALP